MVIILWQNGRVDKRTKEREVMVGEGLLIDLVVWTSVLLEIERGGGLIHCQVTCTLMA